MRAQRRVRSMRARETSSFPTTIIGYRLQDKESSLQIKIRSSLYSTTNMSQPEASLATLPTELMR